MSKHIYPKKCIAYSNWLLLKWAMQHLSWRWTSNYLSVSEAEGLWQSKRTISNTFWIFVLEKYFSILILKSGCIINISWPFLHRLVFQSMVDIVSNSLHVHDVCLFKKLKKKIYIHTLKNNVFMRNYNSIKKYPM